MATSPGKSTTQDLEDELDENLDYEETCDVAKARRVVTLVNRLMPRLRSSAGHGGSSFTRDLSRLKELRSDARTWIRANGGAADSGRQRTNTVYHQPARGFRG